MAARKKATRKKTAAKKAKKGARKKSAKKATRKKATKRKSTASLATRTRKAIDSNLRDLERELPRNLKSVIHDIRRGVSDLEDQIEKAKAEGEARWQELEDAVRRDSERFLKRFGIGAKKKRAARKKSARKKTAKKKSTRKKAARKATRRKTARR